MDTAYPDQWKLPLHTQIGLRQHTCGQRKQRLAGEAAGFCHRPLQTCGAGNCRIRDNHAVNAALAGNAHHIIKIIQCQIRRDFQQNGTASCACADLVARRQNTREQVIQCLCALQITQARRIGRGNIDGEVAGNTGKAANTQNVIGAAVCRFLIRTQIHPDNSAAPAVVQPVQGRLMTFIIEAETIDQAGLCWQAEYPWLRIAALRLRCNRADFGKTEAESEQSIRHFGIFVKTGGHAQRIVKMQAKGIDTEARIIFGRPLPRHEFERCQSSAMRCLRLKPQQQGLGKGCKAFEHQAPNSGNRCTPFSSGKGLTHTA